MNNKTSDFKELVEFVNSSSMANKLKKKRQKRIIIFISNIITISSLIGGGIGIKTILDNKRDYEESLKYQESLKNIPVTESIIYNDNDNKKEEIISTYSLNEYINKNPDTIGYLKVKGTDIDLPVVKTDNNDFYLNHDFDKKWNSMGWVYADYRNNFPNFSQNTILYGHTYKDTIMFSSLKNVLNDDWFNNKDNHIIEFNSTNKEHKWQVFSIYTIEKTSDYLGVEFNDQEFINFTNMLKNRSLKNFNVEINEDDKILTLSTCYISSKYRLVVHAKLIK